MIVGYLLVLCFLAAVNIVWLYHINPKQNGPYPSLFYFVFVTCVGHLFLALSTTPEEIILANKMNYVGSAFLPMFTFVAILQVCNVQFPHWARIALLVLSFVVFGLSATVGFSDIYYTSIEYVKYMGVGNYVAEYGPGHAVFNFMLVCFAAANIGLIIYAFAKKKNVSYKSLIALSLIELASVLSFVIARFVGTDTLVMPAVYVFDQFALLYICYRVRRYDIAQTVLNTLEANNTDGYLSISSKMAFLGGNDIACGYFPEFNNCRVDHGLTSNAEVVRFFRDWIQSVNNGSLEYTREYERGSSHFKCTLKIVPISNKQNLNLIKIEEDTELHRYVKMLGNDNSRLESMVEESSHQIRAIQEQMVVGMANMVESRDSSTGGHIKRTSKVVSILVNELRREHFMDCSDSFYNALIRSAPMHDLGKIAVDDAILRKPGRFTDDEYKIMKSHSIKGAAIVENLLSSLENPEFVQIARNVALSHHERYDGTGYPYGLKGDQIPVEARIMAVADVYDALVSKRCYKDELSFDKAYDIIVDGMGTHFDPHLRECFENARSQLEDYYSKIASAG